MDFTKNNNRAVINRLAKSSLKANRGRNIPAIITIAISLCLTTFFVLSPFSIQNATERMMVGRYQASVYDVDEEQVALLEEALGQENVGLYAELRTWQTPEYSLNASYKTENLFKIGKTDYSGQVPKLKNEIMATENLLSFFGAKIGDEVSLDIGFGTEKYRVSGTTPMEDESKSFDIVVSKELLKAYEEKVGKSLTLSAYIHVPNIQNQPKEEQLDTIYKIMDQVHIDADDVFLSNRYKASLDSINMAAVLAAATFILWIMIVSSVVIYNIFYISIANNVREYGRLRALGATKKQVGKIVKRQGIPLAMIGGVIGIILGNIVSFIVIPDGLKWSTSVVSSVFLLFFSYFLVTISLRKPAKIASNITPIDALRFISPDNEKQLNSRQSGKVHPSTPFRLALLNFKRNRKKAITTVISLSLAGILIGGVGAYFSSISIEKMVRTDYLSQGDFFISLYNEGANDADGYATSRLQQDNPINNEFIREISELPGVSDVRVEQGVITHYTIASGYRDNLMVSAVSPSESDLMSEKLEKGNYDYDDMVKNNGIIVTAASTIKEISGWDATLGDRVAMEFWTPDGLVTSDFVVMGTMDELPKTGYFLLPEETMQNILPGSLNYKIIVEAQKNQIEKLDNELRAIVSKTPNLYMQTITDMYVSQKTVMQQAEISIMVVVFLIGAFGLISLTNTIITSTVSRRQELGILQAVGMTKRQLKETVMMEGFIYSAVTAASTLTLGTLAGYIFCYVVNLLSSTPYLDYTFPILVIALFLLVLLITQVSVSLFSIRIYQKEPLAERIKRVE